MRVPDATADVPLRRMSVARGTLRSPQAPDADALAAAKAAAVLAAKDAARLLPASVPFQLTDAFCDFTSEGSKISCTMTVQAFARRPISQAALLGAAAALVSIAESLGYPGPIEGLHIVQDVEG